MGTIIHSAITDTEGIHLPQDFASASMDTALIKNSSGNLEYRSISTLGASGPAGPAGTTLASLVVVDIDDPSSELASEGGVAGDILVVREVNAASSDEETFYLFDSDVITANSPYIVTGSSGTWIAVAGKYQNQDINTNGDIIVTGSSLVDGRNISVDGTKLDGIEALAAVNDPFADAAPPDITDTTGAVGTEVEKAREDHTHGHGNRGGGTLHADATESVDGFLPSADKIKLNDLAFGWLQYRAAATTATGGTAVVALATDTASFPNGLWNKLSASEFEVLVDAFVEIEYTVDPDQTGNNNGSHADVFLNNTSIIPCSFSKSNGRAADAENTAINNSFIVQLAADDVIELRITADAGTITALSANDGTFMKARIIRLL